jgi:hypothetical protein
MVNNILSMDYQEEGQKVRISLLLSIIYATLTLKNRQNIEMS